MQAVLIVYGISVLSIILGFVALLTQKVYIDRERNMPTQVEVPLFGKLKTNYPALIFVFLGFLMAYVAFDRSRELPKRDWLITGSFVSDDSSINLADGRPRRLSFRLRMERGYGRDLRDSNETRGRAYLRGCSGEDCLQSLPRFGHDRAG